MTKYAVACICVGDKYNLNDFKKVEKMVGNEGFGYEVAMKGGYH